MMMEERMQVNSQSLYPEGDPYKHMHFQQPDNAIMETEAPIYNQSSCDAQAQQPLEGMANLMPDINRLKKKSKKKTIPFWSEDPNILLNKDHITELFPTENMSFTQKLNAITRLVIIMTILSFLYSKSMRIVGIGALSILAIFLLYFAYEKTKKEGLAVGQAGFKIPDPSLASMGPMEPNPLTGELNMTSKEFSQTFDTPTPDNPLSNVLVPDYGYNVDKKPAPPSFTQKGSNTILENAKKMVVEQNPGQPDIADKLFGDLGDEMVFEQSLQPFYSNANTSIPNDQGAFAQFCYGGMISAKEGNMLALGRNNPRTIDGHR